MTHQSPTDTLPKTTFVQKLKVFAVFILLTLVFGALLIPLVMAGMHAFLHQVLALTLAAMFSAKFARWMLGTGEYAQKVE